EAMQEQDERAVASALSICAACDACSQPTYIFFAHEAPLFHIQILQQRDEAVEEGFDDGLLVERHERALLVRLDFADDVLDLFRTNFVVLAKSEGLDHLLAQPSQH